MAGPLDLRGRVIITDAGATGTLSRIQGLMAGIAAAAKAPVAALGAVQRQGRQIASGGTGTGGLGATLVGGYFLKSQYDLEKALNFTQSILDITDKTKFKPLRDEVIRLATAYPAMSHAVARGTAEMAQAGMPLQVIIATLESTVQGAMATGESIKTVAAGVTDVVLGMAMPFKTAAEQAQSFANVNDILAAASSSANDTYVGFLHGLSKAAPVARALGVDLTTLATAHGALAQAGIKAERAGTALRTMMVRMVVPTKKARQQMAAEGIDLSRYVNMDTSKLSAGGLIATVSNGLGEDLSGINGPLSDIINDPALKNNIGVMGDKLTELIANHLDVGKGDVQGRKLISESIRSYLASTASTLDLQGALKHLGDSGASITLMKELMGVRHIEKALTLVEQMLSGKFEEMRQQIIDKTPGAVARRAGIQMQGYVGAVDRMISAWDGFLRTLADAGVIDNVTGAITSVTQAITALGKSNPKLLEWGTYAVLAAAAAAPLGFALAGLSAGLGVLVGGALMIGRFSAALIGLAVAARRVPAALAGLRAALTLSASAAAPVGAPVLGTGAAAAAGAGGVAGMMWRKRLWAAAKRVLGPVGWAAIVVSAMQAAIPAVEREQTTGEIESLRVQGERHRAAGRGDVADKFFARMIALEDYLAGRGPDPRTGAHAAAPAPGGQSGVGGFAAPGLAGEQGQGARIADETAAAMARAQEIIRGVDLTSEGQRIMESLANGLRAGIGSIDAAMAQAAASVTAGAARVRLNTGPAMRGAN